MINCDQCLAQLDAYFDGALDPVQQFRIERHGRSCPTCGRAGRAKFKEKLRERGPFEVYVATARTTAFGARRARPSTTVRRP